MPLGALSHPPLAAAVTPSSRVLPRKNGPEAPSTGRASRRHVAKTVSAMAYRVGGGSARRPPVWSGAAALVNGAHVRAGTQEIQALRRSLEPKHALTPFETPRLTRVLRGVACRGDG